jgi:hypothetical protein
MSSSPGLAGISVGAINDQSCRAQLGTDSPSTLAAYIGVLDCDFDVVTPKENSSSNCGAPPSDTAARAGCRSPEARRRRR